MKDISIIIVNYNVRYFIEQCLYSVYKAKKHLKVEIFVVDNNSVDDSVESIRKNFPDVKLIENKVNAGFAKANNQAIKLTDSKYTLLLNPDTIVSDDTLIKIFEFMEAHPEAGASGVKLIDGEGRFLPESKRSIPTPMVSLFRLTGLSKLFPKSRIFNKYNLGYLDENKIHEVDVLCGAFMFIRNEVFSRAGFLDEDFFMYGEDIDFSYRITKAGFKIYYFPETTTIHFKGESTKKSSIKYHHTFYKAMSIFARKHFGVFNISLFFINIAIIFAASISYFRKNLNSIIIPFIDFILFFSILVLFQKIWAEYYYHNPDYYSTSSTSIFYALFSLLSVLSIYFFNGYSKKYFVNSIKGIFAGTIAIFVVYAFLPESLRFSRAIIVFGAALSLSSMVLFRMLIKVLFPKVLSLKDIKKSIAVIGMEDEVNRVLRIMDINRIQHIYAGAIFPCNTDFDHKKYLGNISRINELVEVMKIDEVIFCLKNIEISEVVNYLAIIGNKVKVKIFPDETHSIIGSSDRNSKGEFYSIDIDFRLSRSNVRRLKYFTDVLVAMTIIIIFPVISLITKSIRFRDVLSVIKGRKTWISYMSADKHADKLPNLKPGVFLPVIIGNSGKLNDNEIHNINVEYARNYSFWSDIEILIRNMIEFNKV